MSETNFDIQSLAEGMELEELRRLAAEKVIDANVNPAALSEQQHAEVEAIRTLASTAIMDANSYNFTRPGQLG